MPILEKMQSQRTYNQTDTEAMGDVTFAKDTNKAQNTPNI